MPHTGVVVVGAGQAGVQLAASLRQNGYDRPITLIGDEAGLPYQRPPLSKAYLSGDVPEAALRLRPANFFAAKAIELRPDTQVAAIDRHARHVVLGCGTRLEYDHLVLATGARNRTLTLPGAELEGVVALRSLAEATMLRDRLAQAQDVVIIGAGFIGLELAATAATRGVRVHVLEIAARPLARAVSAPISEALTAAHTAWGTVLRMQTGVRRIMGLGRVTGIETDDGTVIPADLVIVGIGATARTELAAAAGLPVGQGIVVDAHLCTADPAISAIGDCALFPSVFTHGMARLESVQNAMDQAKCVAARQAGRPSPYADVPWFWSDQGTLKLQIVGLTGGHDAVVLRGAPESGSFSAFCFQGERLLGIESLNSPADHMAGRKLLAAGTPLTHAQAADIAFDLKAAA